MRRTVRSPDQIAAALRWAGDALRRGLEGGKPVVLEVKREKRSDPQNRRLWAMLSDVAAQVVWGGQKYGKEEWKIILMHAHMQEQKLAPGIGGGIVPLGYSSSAMSVAEMCELQEIITAFGAEHGVKFRAPEYTGR